MDHDPSQPLYSPASPSGAPTALGRRPRIVTLAIALGIVLLLGGGYWAIRHWGSSGQTSTDARTPPAEDPRLTYNGPFQNIHPDVAFVGDAKCAKCHPGHAATYREHPMGRSLAPASRIDPRVRFGSEAHNPFDALGVQFRVERNGQRLLYHQVIRDDKGEPVFDVDTPIDFALGSGTRGYSYLTNRDGYLSQAPVSWYAQRQIWDVSPGFVPYWRPGRLIQAECLFCHANRVNAREDAVNGYEQPIFDGYTIGCERCHGPGQRHVAARGHDDPTTGTDTTIVNPRRLKPEMRAAVCEQCHITGEARVVPRGRGAQDFRPGLPFEAFRAVLVFAAEPGVTRKAVNHVEQMYQSKCFERSTEDPEHGRYKLGCISCHNPHQHVPAAQRTAHYRSACLECHQQRGCSVPVTTRRQTSKDDSCIDCHMPRYASTDIPHNASTDHRIRRRPGKDEAAEPAKTNDEPTFALFHEERLDPTGKDYQRDMGICLSHVLGRYVLQGQTAFPRLTRQALDLLDKAVRNDPDDVTAWDAKAEVLTFLNRREDALEAYEASLARDPGREVPLVGAATTAQNVRQFDRSLAHWRRAVAVNPWQATHRANLAQLLSGRKDWDEAREQAEAWVRLDPARIEARVLLVICLANSGDKARARAEFAKIERLHPSNLPTLQARFAVELRDP